jgi:nucleotide-binding universal stress UspA family protein
MFKRILFATDGSPASDHAAEMAVSMARLHGASLTALYVVDPYPYLGIGEANPMGFEAYMNSAREHATLALSRLATLGDREQPALALNQRIVEDVAAVEGILRTAADERCDLIMVGSHGRTGLSRLMLGSVASKVVAQSSIPVLVVR